MNTDKLYKDALGNVFGLSPLDIKNGRAKRLTALTDTEVEAYNNKPEFGVWNGNGWDIDEESKQSSFRVERNQLLIEADIEINKLDDLNMDSSSWRAYRQALRDSTENWVLPTKPEGAK